MQIAQGGITMWSKSKKEPYLLTSPAILVLLLVVGFPLVYGIYLSFTNMNVYSFRNPKVIGLENYIKIFGDPVFYSTFFRTVIWTVVNVFFHVFGGLCLAMLLNRKFPLKNFYRVMLMVPWAVPQYIAVITWKNMFRGTYGTISILQSHAGLNIEWLIDPAYTFLACMITNIWLGIPFMMMVILGGLQSIPNELYEASEIDGASGFQAFKNITLPLLKSTVVPATIIGGIWTFNMVNVIFIFTDNSGQEETQILVSRVYKDAFNFFAYGRAAAWSVIIFLILAVFSVGFIKMMMKEKEAYE